MYKYHEQVGYANCAKGWIHDVRVTKHYPYNAQNCGIATALTFLCMIDRDVNPGNQINVDLGKEFGYDEVTIALARRRCAKIVALVNISNPPEGANAYFSAARLARYNMFIVERKSAYAWLGTYAWLHRREAKMCYNRNGYRFVRYHSHWYFCKLW